MATVLCCLGMVFNKREAWCLDDEVDVASTMVKEQSHMVKTWRLKVFFFTSGNNEATESFVCSGLESLFKTSHFVLLW